MQKKLATKSESPDKARKPGRPKAETVRETRLPVRFSSEEIEQIRRYAYRDGYCSVSSWVRKRLELDGTGYGE